MQQRARFYRTVNVWVYFRMEAAELSYVTGFIPMELDTIVARIPFVSLEQNHNLLKYLAMSLTGTAILLWRNS